MEELELGGKKYWIDYYEYLLLRQFYGRPVHISMETYTDMLKSVYSTMPEDIRLEYVKEYMLMKGTGFPTITKEHIELYGKL